MFERLERFSCEACSLLTFEKFTKIKRKSLASSPPHSAVTVDSAWNMWQAARSFSHIASPRRIFSGIQPTGGVTLGNYLGALQGWVKMQHELASQDQMILSVVDLHALTSARLHESGFSLREMSRSMAASVLACGIDAKRVILFRQSDVAEHSELAWLLNCITPLGELQRMTQFKEKSAHGGAASAPLGLLAYPVLQAADILLYRATHVPVGEDQTQHLELTRTIARLFNNHTKRDFMLPPETVLSPMRRVMSLRDASKKMSKSDTSDDSRINLDDPADVIVKKIKRAKTDSLPVVSAESSAEVQNLIAIYAALKDSNVQHCMSHFEGKPSSFLKQELADLLVHTLAPISQRMIALSADPSHVESVLRDGAERARAIAHQNITQIRGLVGI